MAPTDRDPGPDDPAMPPATVAPPKPLPRTFLFGGLVVMSGFVFAQAPPLYDELRGLSHDRANDRASTSMAYLDISPHPSFARPPDPWYRDEGDRTMLWAGWKQGVGHRWFATDRGDLDPSTLTFPCGRDVVRAIDLPIFEADGDDHWERLPGDATVVGLDFNQAEIAVPLLVVGKVELINGEVEGQPYLMTCAPFAGADEALSLFDPVVDGQRLTFGSSGMFRDERALYYDRTSEGLWTERPEGLVALTGDRKGRVLKRIGRPEVLSWSDWRSSHPDGRLIVGADRSGGLPSQ